MDGQSGLLPITVDASTASDGAQQFPDAASRKISLSRVTYDPVMRSRSFSFSNSFDRFTWFVFNPPFSRNHW